MIELFLSTLNMSLTAGYVIIFVMFIRLLLKKAPKVISYALWGVVAFRLIIPFSFESIFSLLPRNTNTIPITHDIIYQQIPQVNTRIEGVESFVNGTLSEPIIESSLNPLRIYIEIGAYIWILGMIALLIYSIVSILILKKQLKSAELTEQNIYEAENLKTPFVIGFIRPKIYLPAGLSIEERSYILLHEQTHLHRKDYIVKILAFIILSMHWFNPLVWIAFRLMSTDMELSCDERVLKEMNGDIKKPYATSLLSLATGKHILNGSPLAFGEGNLKGRIKNVLNYKRPKFWVVAFSIVFVVIAGIGLMANPKAEAIIGGADGTTDIIIRSKDEVVLAESEGITLIANNEIDGMYKDMIVETKDKINSFPSWANVTNPTYIPTINVADVDDDGKDEVIIVLTTGYGTGVGKREIHILNMEDLSEISIENPFEAINKKITSNINENEGKVNVTVKWDGKVIEESYYAIEDSVSWFDEVTFGSHIYYDIVDNKIMTTISGAVSHSRFPIQAFLGYNSDLKIDTITIELYHIYPYGAFDLPLTEIPYYQKGEIVFKEESFFRQWEEGHQPWLANAVDVVTVMCSNLIGSDVQKTFGNENIELHTAEELRTKNGIIIKEIDKIDNEVNAELVIPNLGRYEITLESPDTTGVLFIKQIIFYPN